MAMYRQTSGGNGPREGDVADYVSIGIRGGSRHFQPRRSKPPPAFGISLGLFFVTLSFVLSISALFYFILQSKVEITKHQAQEDNTRINAHFLTNATRTKASKGPTRNRVPSVLGSVDSIISAVENRNNKSSSHEPRSVLDRQGNGSSNEAGRSEVKIHEAKNEASLNDTNKDGEERSREAVDDADEYDDGLDLHTEIVEELDNAGLEGKDSASTKPHTIDAWESSHVNLVEEEKQVTVEEVEEKASIDSSSDKTLPNPMDPRVGHHSERAGSAERPPARRLIPHKGKKPRHKHKVSAGTCAMRMLNSTAMLVEPIESRKFARFALQYVEKEEKQIDSENWEPRFAGHQSRREREDSFIARDQKIKCGFVNGPDESQSTGFILAEDDKKYISTCHIAVSTCIFGNSDRLRSPMGKTVSRLSKKNVCFVMFVDEVTLQTLTSEGQMPDAMGFIGLWKILVVKNLPYSDMRRVGKIPKLLSHRLFPSARYSIWLDSKLRLQLDPLLILEYFLWRKGYEYAISNHYDRHCLWEEVAQNKRLNKYNHSIIDEQFSFYQADGMRRFNASDPDKLLPSNVPEGSFIIRAHTPMSNLFSCLWFNEVDRFTPRDQLSFAYTYHKLNRMNPEKPFYLNMFKDCERRKIAKLYRHRNEEKRTSLMSHIDL